MKAENTVYVIQHIAGSQAGTPKINIIGAKDYGDLVFLLPEFSQMIFSPGPLVYKLRQGLKNFKTIIDGDEKVKSISAASIIAKVYRDKLMIKLSEKFQNYAWERNFGYGTKAHMEGLKKFGITSHHRKGFKPIHKMLSS